MSSPLSASIYPSTSRDRIRYLANVSGDDITPIGVLAINTSSMRVLARPKMNWNGVLKIGLEEEIE